MTVWMNFLPLRKDVVCISGHKEFFRLDFYGHGRESKDVVFQARLLISKCRKGVCHSNVCGNNFYVVMADDRLPV